MVMIWLSTRWSTMEKTCMDSFGHPCQIFFILWKCHNSPEVCLSLHLKVFAYLRFTAFFNLFPIIFIKFIYIQIALTVGIIIMYGVSLIIVFQRSSEYTTSSFWFHGRCRSIAICFTIIVFSFTFCVGHYLLSTCSCFLQSLHTVLRPLHSLCTLCQDVYGIHWYCGDAPI